MNRFSLAWQLLRAMGPRWVLYRGAYAARQRAGWDAWRLPITSWDQISLASVVGEGTPSAPDAYEEFRRRSGVRFFLPPRNADRAALFADWDLGRNAATEDAARIKSGEFLYFDHEWHARGRPPDWHCNPLTGERVAAVGHWSQLDEFRSGDIKLVWELNRFSFAFPLVRAYWRTGDESLAECFWQLVEDWCAHNPPQAGLNWKCGQEASFRAMAWCFGLYGFAGARAQTPARVALLARVLAVTGRRVASNFRHGLNQRNNHGISEATGLWTLGTLFPEFREAAQWKEQGRAALEAQARELIYDDGGFSQQSVNYHRVMLEDYLWCIQLGRANGIEFSSELVRRVRQAGHWLESLQDSDTGRLPNWGSNDGAHVLPLSNCGYLDYRPVVQLAATVASGSPGLPAGPWDELAWWLGCTIASRTDDRRSPVRATGARQDFRDSGLTVLRAGEVRVVVRTARRFRHRPAQCDLLHLDLWDGARNVLRDTGSYRYNSPDNRGVYFKSAAAHNTIQFDDHDQMPVLGRFLYGRWPHGEVSLPEDDPAKLLASYTDWRGCRHQREVTLGQRRCLVADRLSGPYRKAILRWHLCPETIWELSGSTCTSSRATIRVAGDGITSSRLAEGEESLFYNASSPLKVFEVVLASPASAIQTEIILA